jgi:hypothetical protein
MGAALGGQSRDLRNLAEHVAKPLDRVDERDCEHRRAVSAIEHIDSLGRDGRAQSSPLPVRVLERTSPMCPSAIRSRTYLSTGEKRACRPTLVLSGFPRARSAMRIASSSPFPNGHSL